MQKIKLRESSMVSEERIKTNLLLMDELDMWDEFTIKAINDEWTLRYYNHIMNLLNNQVVSTIKWLDSDDAKELFFEEVQYQYELFQSLEDEWDEILESKYPSVEALLDEVYRRGKAKGYAEMREHIRFSDTDKSALAFVREYNFGLIKRLDNDTRNQIKSIITSSVLSGENPRKVAPRIYDVVGDRLDGSTFTPMQRAVMIARTEVSRVQNTGILQSYVNEGYQEVKILTAEDSNVCYTCLSYAYDFNEETPVIFENRGKEKVHNIIELIKGELFPPFHPNCRCTYLSVWGTKQDPPLNPILIKLIPNLESFHMDFVSQNNLKWNNIKKSDLPEELPNAVKDCLIDFESRSDEFIKIEGESGVTYNLSTGENYGLVSQNNEKNVLLVTIVEDPNDILSVSHNHSNGSPPSIEDIIRCIDNGNNVKFVNIHGPNDILTMGSKGKIVDDEILREIIGEFNECSNDGYIEAVIHKKPLFDTIKINLIKNELLNKYIDFYWCAK